MNGLHLIGDLTGCRCDPQLLLDGQRFRAKCLEMVAASGLTTMDATFHTFDGGGSRYSFTPKKLTAPSHRTNSATKTISGAARFFSHRNHGGGSADGSRTGA